MIRVSIIFDEVTEHFRHGRNPWFHHHEEVPVAQVVDNPAGDGTKDLTGLAPSHLSVLAKLAADAIPAFETVLKFAESPEVRDAYVFLRALIP